MAARKKRRWRGPALGALVATGAIAWAIGPGAAWIVDALADGQKIWRLGRIDIDGVSGPWLGDLRATRASLADETGLWLQAENLALSWRPLDIAFGAVRLEHASAERIEILRRPALSRPRPVGNINLDVQIGDIRIETLALAEPVVGAAATFAASFSLDVSGQELRALELELARTDAAKDSGADRAMIQYRSGEQFALQVDVEGAPGGVFAHALGAADQGVRATARGDGGANEGQARYDAALGERELFSGAARWGAENWQFDIQAQLDAAPALRTLARRIGASASLNAAGARAGVFNLHAQTPFIAVDLDGKLTEDYALDGPAHFVASTERLSDIARESPFAHGKTRLRGQLRRARGVTAIAANLEQSEVNALGRATTFAGPVSAALTPDRFTLRADVRTPEAAPALFANARLKAELSYDRTRERFSLDQAELSGDAVMVDARGWVNRGDGEFSGAWRARRLDALLGILSGAAAGRWRAFSEPGDSPRVWTTNVDGVGERVGGASTIVNQLLGAAPRIDARLRYESRGLTVSHARVDGARVRAGAAGRIVRGQTDLALEASARGPLSLGNAEIAGAIDATGRLTGPLARPSLEARATLSSLAATGLTITQPMLEFTLTPAGPHYAGQRECRRICRRPGSRRQRRHCTCRRGGCTCQSGSAGRRHAGSRRCAPWRARGQCEPAGQRSTRRPCPGAQGSYERRPDDYAGGVDARRRHHQCPGR